MTRVILIEFNELTPRLLDAWMASGDLPNFKHFHDRSQVFVTEADDSDPVNLEPWIQWYSIHTGLPFRQHGVFHLTDGLRAGHPDVWSVLHGYGKRVWNCASMNARGFSYEGSAFLSDPWCSTESAHPAELTTFQRFVAHQVQEHAKPENGLGLRDNAGFIAFMATHGLRLSTVSAITRQLLSEITSSGDSKWRRVALLDRLQFDVFRHYYRRFQPDFCSFFLNSTAHLQHAYWRHMEPDAFTIQPSTAEVGKYKDAILFGYQEMDRLLGEFEALAGPDVQLILATALSQQPYTKYEAIGGHHFYRPHAVHDLLATLGITTEKIMPVMTHQFLAHFADQAQAERAKDLLSRLMLDGRPVFGFDSSEPGTLYFGNQMHTLVEPGSRIMTSSNSDTGFDYYEVFYRIDAMKSGRHHPDGCLWIRNGKHERHQDKVSILDILPTILAMYDLPTHAYAGRPLLNHCHG